jgi:uncharacterized membrane protein
MEYIKQFLVAASTMLIIDGIWLGIMMQRFYKKQMGDLVAKNANFVAAGLFYVLYVAGLVYLIIAPALENKISLGETFIRGAVFGLVAYATYDLTNQATLKNWPTIVTVVDLIWGTLLTGTVAVIAVKILRAL